MCKTSSGDLTAVSKHLIDSTKDQTVSKASGSK